MRVRWQLQGSPPSEAPAKPCDGQTSMNFLMAGLRAGTAYSAWDELVTGESFRINIPTDRIMVGAPRQAEPLPPGLQWPADELFDGVRVELFKLRNTEDAVVGVASRMVAESDTIEDSVEWVLHLPARGTFYVTMPVQPADGVRRVGTLRAGTREFGPMQGSVSERWVANTDNDDVDAPDGYIELETSLVGTFSDEVSETALREGAL